MIVSRECVFFNSSFDSISDIIKTVSKEHNEKYGYNDFYKTTVKGNIEFVELINNKTKNVNVIGYNQIRRAQGRTIASKGRKKIITINKISIILESELKKYVIETYMKIGIPMIWRKFFKKIAENRDYIYNYCANNQHKKFNGYCIEWYTIIY